MEHILKTHQEIMQEMGLAFIDPEIGSGLPMWMPDGALLKKKIENFIRGKMLNANYLEVDTPHIGDISLYKTSGHYPYYEDSQFAPIQSKDGDSGWLLKPMNCPHHVRIYQEGIKSYRDLPFKICEFGKVYRHEASGALNGLFRARAFIQDDGHMFVMESQLENELKKELNLFREILSPFEEFGLKSPSFKLSLRGEGQKYVGDQGLWDKAESYARNALVKAGIVFTESPGDAAFYGPKIDLTIKDSLDRDWQLGTIQIDFNLPERFNLSYVSSENKKERPVMVHRAALGSLERFIGILLESTQGHLPIGLHPCPVVILPVSEDVTDYAMGVKNHIREYVKIKVPIVSEDSLSARIARASVLHVPQIWIVGKKEREKIEVTVREKGNNTTLCLLRASSLLDGQLKKF